jgi:hypothetical protein
LRETSGSSPNVRGHGGGPELRFSGLPLGVAVGSASGAELTGSEEEFVGEGGEIADDDSGLRLLGGTGVPEGVVGSSANPPAVLDADIGLSEPRDGFTLDGATTATTSNTATAAYSGA